ncbi:MAG: clostripain-related cysteine peptidase, partial [Alistipes onderdonkii]
ALGNKRQEKMYYNKVKGVLRAIEDSGDALTQKTPRHILMFDHALDVMASEGYTYGKSRIISRTVEFIPFTAPRMVGDKKRKGLYYDFGRVYWNTPEGYTHKRDRTWQFNNLKPRTYNNPAHAEPAAGSGAARRVRNRGTRRADHDARRSGIAQHGGFEAAFTVSSTEAWSLTTEGSGFDVSPTHGGRGETTGTVRAQDANPTTRRKALGSMALRLSSGKAEATVTVVQSPTVAPQTVVMYLPWSGNLYTHFLQNIEDVKKAVAGNILHDSRLLLFLQTSTTKGTLSELYYDNGECRETELRTYEDLNVTQAETITGIFDYIKQTAPAERYGITIGSHGMAWIPASGSGRSAADAKAGTEPTATTVREKWHWEYVSPDGQFTRWFGDGGSRCTNTTTFAEAITAAGIRFEYILFDDCFMSSIEVAYDLRKITRHLIASPCEVMAYGYPYDLVMPYLFTDGGTGYDLDGVCRSFYEFYEQYEAPNYNCGAIAVTVCDQVDKMAEVMRLINNASPAYIPDPEKPLQQYEYLYAPTRFYDLADYVYQLCDDTALLKEFDEQLARTVPERYRLHTEYFYSGGKRPLTTYSGISTSAPSTSGIVVNNIQNTGWYKATH